MYYNIKLDWNPKVIGVKNGVYQVELDRKAYDKTKYQILDSLFIGGEFSAKQEYPELTFNLYFKKLKSAKKTSFMSFAPYFKHGHFLVNKQILELFGSFNIQRYKDYEAVIYASSNADIDNNYRLFYCVLQDWNVIDFKNTVFTSGGFGNSPKIEHRFLDENDLYNFNGITKVKTLALDKTFDKTLDFFHTRLGGLFVSEKLKLALEESGVTGIIFKNDVEVLM